MAAPSFYKMRRTFKLCALLAFTAGLASMAHGQEIVNLNLTAPPPMKFVSRDERAQLSATQDIKGRTRLSLELAEARLLRAEELAAQQQFDAAASHLGAYQGLIEDAMRYLSDMGSDSGKVRDNFKRLELALRKHGPRIESIRRVTPYEHAVNVKAVLDYTRDARSNALNSFYGETVLPDVSSENKKSFNAERPTGSAPNP